MFDERAIPHRQEGEHLVIFMRAHWIELVGIFLTTAIIFIIPPAIYNLFLTQYQDALLNNPVLFVAGTLLLCAYYLMGLLILFNRFIDFHFDVWIVTNKRIISIHQNNIFSRTMSEQQLERVQDVTANQQGMLQTIFGFGNIETQTAAEKERFIFENVPKPFEVADTINRLLAKKTSAQQN